MSPSGNALPAACRQSPDCNSYYPIVLRVAPSVLTGACAQAGLLADYWASNGSGALAAAILCGGVIAMVYNVVHYRMIQITSATLTPVIGMIKARAKGLG